MSRQPKPVMPCNRHAIYFHFLFLTTLSKTACAEGNQSKPFIEWCENAQERRRAEDCGAVAFVYPYPKCYCLNGIALIKVAHDVRNVREVQFGTGGCYNQRNLGVHNRTVELAHAQFSANDTVMGLQTSEDSFEFFNAPLDEPKPTGRRIVLFNGDLIDMEERFKGGRLYCVEKSGNGGEDSGLVRMYSMPAASWVWFNGSCNSGDHAELEILHAGRLLTPENSPCFPVCPPYDTKKSTYNRPSLHLQNTTNCKPMPRKLGDIHRDLNERILRHAVDHSFQGQPEPNDNKPSNSFKILEIASRIASKFCRNAHVPSNFLEVATDYFKIAHEGRGFYFNEELSHHEFMSISQLLRRCLFYMNETLQFGSIGCNDEREVTEVFKLTEPTDRRPVVRSVGHEYFDHHTVLDVPWSVVDLVNVACVDAFAPSYRMYHRLAQGMEKLFTHELRIFWQYPQVPPFYYEHLFGPHWKTHSSNLEKCVEGAYIFAPKMARMIRPQWIPGQTGNSRGKGTLTDPMCRHSRSDIQSISEAFEIYCEPPKSQSPSDIFIDWPEFDAEDPSAIANEVDINWSESNDSFSKNENYYIDVEYNFPDVNDSNTDIVGNFTDGNEDKPLPELPIETTLKPARPQKNYTTMKPAENIFVVDLPESDEDSSSPPPTLKYYITWPHRIARQSEAIQKVSLIDANHNSSAAGVMMVSIDGVYNDASVIKPKDNEISDYFDETDQMLDDVSIGEPRKTLRDRRSFATKYERPTLINWPSDPGDPLLPPAIIDASAPNEASDSAPASETFDDSVQIVDKLHPEGPTDSSISGNSSTSNASETRVIVYSESNSTESASSDQNTNTTSAPIHSQKSDDLDYPVENLADALETKNPSVPSGIAAETTFTDADDSKPAAIENKAEEMVLDYPTSNIGSALQGHKDTVDWSLTTADEAGFSIGNIDAGFQDGDPLVSGATLDLSDDVTGDISVIEDEQPIYLIWPGDLNTISKRQSYTDIFLDWPQTNLGANPGKVVDPGLVSEPVGPPGTVLDLPKRPKSNNMHPPGTLLDLQKRKKPPSYPPGTLLDLRRRKKPQSTPQGKLLDLPKRRKFLPPGHHGILLDLPKRTSPKPSLMQPKGKLLDLPKHSKTAGRVDEEPVYIRWPSAMTRRSRASQLYFLRDALIQPRTKKSQKVDNLNFWRTNDANLELQDIYPTGNNEVLSKVLDGNDADDIYPTEGFKIKRSGSSIEDPTDDIYPTDGFKIKRSGSSIADPTDDIYPTDGSKIKRSGSSPADPTDDIYTQELSTGSSNDYPDFSDISNGVSLNRPRSVVADDIYDGLPMLDRPIRIDLKTFSNTSKQEPRRDAPIRIHLPVQSEISTGPKVPSEEPIKSDIKIDTQQFEPSTTTSESPKKVASPTRIALKIQNQSVMPSDNASSSNPIRLDLPVLSSNGTSEIIGGNGTNSSVSTTGCPFVSDDSDPIVYINFPPQPIQNSSGSLKEGDVIHNEIKSVPQRMNFPTNVSIIDM